VLAACSGEVSHRQSSEGSGNGSGGAGGGVGASGPTSGVGASGAGTSSGTATGSGAGGSVSCVGPDDCGYLDGQCSDGICEGGLCVPLPINELGACDDFLFCTAGEYCSAGACTGGPPLACPDTRDPCLSSSCDEAAQGCVLLPDNEGAFCDDGDLCTSASFCAMGKCVADDPVDCSALDDQCQVGVCDPMGGCVAVPVNEGALCDDGLFCTVEESCQAGACGGGKPQSCAPPGGCAVSTCNESTDQCVSAPGNEGAACDDANPCTSGSVCSAGACAGGIPGSEGQPCDDGNACTAGDVCSAGQCQGSGSVAYLSEDFADNALGWKLGPEWQIGFAKASVGGAWGADPATDHTSTSDNGVAGIVIGGNALQVPHAPTWLESPAFDTSSASSVIFGYYRWLNSDYEPYMTNWVEVWNGTGWKLLWKSGQPPGVQDSPPTGQGWTYVQHDVTAHKNAAMRVRFGMSIGSSGVFAIGSWNVDDVLVASAPCP
jgi:hypothetical protein